MRQLFLCMLLLPCPLAAVPAQADPAGEPATPSPSREPLGAVPGDTANPSSEGPALVELVVVPGAAEASVTAAVVSSLGQRLKGWFRPNDVVTTRRDATELTQRDVMQPTGHAGVRVWLMFSDSISRNQTGSAHIYFATERSAYQELKFLWRSVELPSGLDEVGLELLVQVMHLSIRALWEGSVETSREQVAERLERERGALPLALQASASTATLAHQEPIQAPAVVNTRATTTLMRSGPSLVSITRATVSVLQEPRTGAFEPALGIGYAIRWRGPEGTAVGPEMMLGANYWFGKSAIGARATWQPLSTEEIALAPAVFDVGGNTLTLGGYASLDAGRAMELTGELGGGLDIIRYRTMQITDPQLEPAVESHDLRPFIYLAGGVQHRVGPLRLGLSTLLAVQVLDTSYGIADGKKFTAQLNPWRIQPGLRLELSWQ
jgi:hypothetical protein